MDNSGSMRTLCVDRTPREPVSALERDTLVSSDEPLLQAAPVDFTQEIEGLHNDIRRQLTEIEQVYQYSPVGLVLMDMDYRFVRINERMAEINGLPVEAHIGRTLREVVPDLADFIMELYRPVYERGEPVLNVELQGPAPNGPDVQRRWLANFFPFRAKGGEVIGLIGAVVDITERMQQESKLRESEERFRTIFETVSDAIFVQNIATGKFVDVNQRAVDMFGYGHDDLLAATIAGLSEDQPPYTGADAQKEWSRRSRDSGKPSNGAAGDGMERRSGLRLAAVRPPSAALTTCCRRCATSTSGKRPNNN